jgi:hypothetical protein
MPTAAPAHSLAQVQLHRIVAIPPSVLSSPPPATQARRLKAKLREALRQHLRLGLGLKTELIQIFWSLVPIEQVGRTRAVPRQEGSECLGPQLQASRRAVCGKVSLWRSQPAPRNLGMD